MSSVVEESLVVSDKHHGLYLLECLKDNADDNDKACARCRNVSSEYTVEYMRQNRYNNKSDCTDENQVVKNTVEIVGSGFSRTDTGDETALSLQVICNHKRIKGYGCVEVREEYQESDVDQKTNGILKLTGYTPVV